MVVLWWGTWHSASSSGAKKIFLLQGRGAKGSGCSLIAVQGSGKLTHFFSCDLRDTFLFLQPLTCPARPLWIRGSSLPEAAQPRRCAALPSRDGSGTTLQSGRAGWVPKGSWEPACKAKAWPSHWSWLASSGEACLAAATLWIKQGVTTKGLAAPLPPTKYASKGEFLAGKVQPCCVVSPCDSGRGALLPQRGTQTSLDPGQRAPCLQSCPRG